MHQIAARVEVVEQDAQVAKTVAKQAMSMVMDVKKDVDRHTAWIHEQDEESGFRTPRR